MNRGIFITGTNTGVGKTYIAKSIIRTLKRLRLTVFPYKPVATGSRRDIQKLCRAAGIRRNFSQFNPLFFTRPLAPLIAARLIRKKINPKILRQQFNCRFSRNKKYDLAVVEGAGGLLVPLTRKYFMIDLIRDLKMPAVLVASRRLGTINQTLLSVEAMKKRKIRILAIVLTGKTSDLASKFNQQIIAELSGIKTIEVKENQPVPLKEVKWLLQRLKN